MLILQVDGPQGRTGGDRRADQLDRDPPERIRERQRLTREHYQRQAEEAKRQAIGDYAAGVEDDADTAEAYAIMADCERELDGALGEAGEHEKTMRAVGLDLGPLHRKGVVDARRRAGRSRLATAMLLYVAPTAQRSAPRPRARRERHVARATSSSATAATTANPRVPATTRRRPHRLLLKSLGLTPRQARWCHRCRRFAYAIDEFERDQLDRLGFRNGGCAPDCAARDRPGARAP